MANKTAHGAEFEELFAKTIGAELVPQSGAGFVYKLDAANTTFLFSLKATKNESFSVKQSDLEEASKGVRGLGGVGEDVVPAFVFTYVEADKPSPKDKVYVTLELDDLVSLLLDETVSFEPSKAESKQLKSKVPSILRE